ncbi:CoA ester lyase [Roseivivax sp. GX 12232]|uniref:HpcH/HpaI aldolase/citrate lyase family protein n=1 Tax=Roseivivax sp. GX 12232 TaxID=2900547 RepID=UPI001E4707C9|nr:CoA ester lyase [Roseivivax sp. GX 12232]MCE0506673.1 CoA ester lyase [Roseivivax sp. GX 12232]
MDAIKDSFATLSFPLFVPADRPERFAKACAAGSDSVIIDLEDAVASDLKTSVRRIPRDALPADRQVTLMLRVNAPGTEWYRDDVAFARAIGFDAVVLPKAESAQQIAELRAALDPGQKVLGLIETVRGVARMTELAEAADRLAFGSIDLAADLGCENTQTAFLPIRSQIVQAARLAGRPAPLDGVTTATRDPEVIAGDARHSHEMGFGGKLLIHPVQIEPARAAFRPAPETVDWAERVVAASVHGGAGLVDGAMIDAPVLKQARRILDRARALA